jgi:hypothetical protein
VVSVDLDVTAGLDGQVQATVPAELPQHVIEERNAGLGLHMSAAVNDEINHDLGLRRRPFDSRGSR